MAEVDLGPDELDRLEDALEELELDGALDRWSEDELGPRVYARLVDYRDVLAATREALPLEDVPAGVLDGVLAQAQQAAATPAVAAVAAQESWWSRVRRSFMVPVLALAGTAALVLWVLDPKDQADVVDPPAPSTPPTAAAEAPARAQADEAARAEQKAAAPAPSAAPVEAAAEPEEEQTLAPGDAPEGAVTTAETRKDADDKATAKPTEVDAGADAGGSKNALGSVYGGVPGGSGGALPGSAQPQKKSGAGTTATAGTSGRWDLVARGDRARQAGDCVAARDEYALALEDDEPEVRARAFAGLGLCDAAAGDEASADANYERARALDDGIGSFIESQSERSRGEKKSRKPAKKSKVAVDDAMDPFE